MCGGGGVDSHSLRQIKPMLRESIIPSNIKLWTCEGSSNSIRKGGASFVDHFCYLCFALVMLSCLVIAAMWSPAGKDLLSVMFFFVFLSLSHVVAWLRCGT